MSLSHPCRATALACTALLATTAGAADMTFTPTTGGGVVIYSAPGAPAIHVQPTGEVQVPGLPAAPVGGTNAVCHDGSGTLQRCDTAALAGPAGAAGPTGPQGIQGPQGPAGSQGVPGTNGTNGINGTNGSNGRSAVLASTPEPAGANCLYGGQRVQTGLQGDPLQTSYVCNGAPGANGGLTGVVHGCFVDSAPLVAGIPTPTSGVALYAVSKDISGPAPTYTISLASAQADAAYTVLLDGRTSTGRALALTATAKTRAALTLQQGWLNQDVESSTPLSICFMLTR